jgi:hypothetical protein
MKNCSFAACLQVTHSAQHTGLWSICILRTVLPIDDEREKIFSFFGDRTHARESTNFTTS